MENTLTCNPEEREIGRFLEQKGRGEPLIKGVGMGLALLLGGAIVALAQDGAVTDGMEVVGGGGDSLCLASGMTFRSGFKGAFETPCFRTREPPRAHGTPSEWFCGSSVSPAWTERGHAGDW